MPNSSKEPNFSKELQDNTLEQLEEPHRQKNDKSKGVWKPRSAIVTHIPGCQHKLRDNGNWRLCTWDNYKFRYTSAGAAEVSTLSGAFGASSTGAAAGALDFGSGLFKAAFLNLENILNLVSFCSGFASGTATRSTPVDWGSSLTGASFPFALFSECKSFTFSFWKSVGLEGPEVSAGLVSGSGAASVAGAAVEFSKSVGRISTGTTTTAATVDKLPERTANECIYLVKQIAAWSPGIVSIWTVTQSCMVST